MNPPHPLPSWATEPAAPSDRERAQRAHQLGMLQISWPDKKQLKAWAKAQGWPTPFFGLHDALFKQLLSTDEAFALALHSSGIALHVPIRQHAITAVELQKLDPLYDSRGANDRPEEWGSLVENLREIRRLVEAGIVVIVEDQQLTDFDSFYRWAHGRYHMLEDGYDSWIGDDS